MSRCSMAASTIIGGTLLGACSLLPRESPTDDSYRRDLDACASRSAAAHDRTQQLLGRNSDAIDVTDPLSPNTLAASNANAELSSCMQSRGHR